jgi:hypothetical protein
MLRLAALVCVSRFVQTDLPTGKPVVRWFGHPPDGGVVGLGGEVVAGAPVGPGTI